MPSTLSSALSWAMSSRSRALAGARVEAVELAAHADLDGGLLFVARVDDAGRVFADEHHVQSRRAAVRLGDEARDLEPHLVTNLLGDRLAIEQLGVHRGAQLTRFGGDGEGERRAASRGAEAGLD
jgi:hypothetical protein